MDKKVSPHDCMIRQRNLQDLERLARERHAHLYRFILRRVRDVADSEELTQQTFLEALRGIDGFRADAQLASWVYGIATNLVANYLCRTRHRVLLWESDEVLEEVDGEVNDPQLTAVQRDLLRRLQSHIDSLPVEMQQIVGLVIIDGMTYAEAASLLDIPVGTVRSRLSRARQILSQLFFDDGAVVGDARAGDCHASAM